MCISRFTPAAALRRQTAGVERPIVVLSSSMPSVLTRDELLEKLGAIDKKALDALLKSLGKKLDKPRVSLLKAELEAHADKRMSPRLWAKEVA